MKHKSLLFILLFSITVSLTAQDPNLIPKVIENSPSSASISKFGTYKVNTFNGLPDISIPLYEIKSGDIIVPIVLSYHASGIRVTDAASWVGLGWALNTGGSITRKVVGIDDECFAGGYGYLSGKLKPISYSFNTSNLTDLDYLNQVRLRNYDTDPDIFSYNFPGRSGNFFFNGQSNYNIVKVPYSPVKIVKYYSPNSLSFDITDEKGNFFKFGPKEYGSGPSDNHSTVTAWMLEKIISQTGKDTVSFSYNSESYNLPGYNIDCLNVIDQVSVITCSGYSSNMGNATSIACSSFISDQKQSEIKFKGGKVVFVKSASNRQDFQSGKLDTIKIYNFNSSTSAYKLIKKIVFHTSYFNSNRLRLDSLSFQDKSGITFERYRFNYNTTRNLPVVNSKSQDYWGYYNGKNNTSLVPETSISFQPSASSGSSNITISAGNSRECDSTYMQANILTRIYFPTGGYTDFEYQTNRYVNYLNQTKLAGGLRIKSIKSYDGISSTPLIKTYKYGPGRANFILENSFFVTTQTHRYISDCGYLNGEGVASTMRERSYNSFPNIDIIPFDGSIVVYPTVTEYIGTPTANAGKTIYKFMDQPDALNSTMAVITSRPAIIDSYSDQRGHLIEKTDFKNSNGVYAPVVRETYSYNTSAFPSKVYPGLGFCCDKRYINDGVTGSDTYFGLGTFVNDCYSFMYNFYSRRIDDNYLYDKTIKTYNLSDTTQFIAQTTHYEYDSLRHQQVRYMSTTDSKGQSIRINYKYASDFAAVNGFLKTMTDKCMYANPIEQYTFTNNYTVSGQINGYKTGNLGAIVPDYIKTLEISSPVSNYSPTSLSSGTNLVVDSRYSTYITFDYYDALNNINSYSPRNSGPATFIWGYRKIYPVAKIEGATYNQVKTALGNSIPDLGPGGLSSTQISSLRGITNSFVTIYNYEPLIGMISSSDPNSVTSFYEYDTFGRLKCIKDDEGRILKTYEYHYK